MEEHVVKNVRVGNFACTLLDNDMIVLACVSTESNDCGRTLGVYTPMGDKERYASVREMLEEDQKGLLMNLCLSLMIAHDQVLMDQAYVARLVELHGKERERLRKMIDQAAKYPEGVEVMSDEEWLEDAVRMSNATVEN